MLNYKYPSLYAQGVSRRTLAQALKISPRKLRRKQHPKSKSDFTGGEIRRASDFFEKPASELFATPQPGYIGILSESGKYIPAECALDYAMERCGITRAPDRRLDAEFVAWFTEWYYSGDWLHDRSITR